MVSAGGGCRDAGALLVSSDADGLPVDAVLSRRSVVLQPLSGRLILVFDMSAHNRPPGVPALLVQADFEVASFRIDHEQYLALNDMLH